MTQSPDKTKKQISGKPEEDNLLDGQAQDVQYADNTDKEIDLNISKF